MCTEIYKILNGIAPSCMQNLSVMNQSRYSSRRPLNLHLPRVNQTAHGLNSLRYARAKLWNSLPEDIKSSENLTTFKRLIKTWNGTTCRCNFCKWWNGDLAGKSMPTLHTPVNWEGSTVCMLYAWWVGGGCLLCVWGFLCIFGRCPVVLAQLFSYRPVVCCYEWNGHGLFSCGMHGVSIVVDSFQWILIIILLECALLLTYS